MDANEKSEIAHFPEFREGASLWGSKDGSDGERMGNLTP
jgi:hypothetical protein